MMSKLDELIQKLCPNGVEYKSLGEIATDMYRGSGIKRTDVTASGTPCVRYGEIYTTYNIWFDKCVSHTTIDAVNSPKYFEHGDVLFAITGESVDEIAKSTVYIGTEKCLAGGDIVVLKHNQDPKYMSYALATGSSRKQKSAGKVKSKVVHASVPSLKTIRIPVPPLEVQREIVRILDKYSECTAALAADLTAELDSRKKQYEYYRDALLNFETNSSLLPSIEKLCPNGVETKTLSETTCFIKDGTHGSLKNSSVGYPLLSAKDVYGGVVNIPDDCRRISEKDYFDIYKNYQLCIGDVLLTIVGTIGRTAIIREASLNVAFQRSVGIIRANDKLRPSFLAYLFGTNNIISQLQKGTNQSAQGGIYLKSLGRIKIPVPPLEVQDEIVAILDRFDTLCNDLTAGLPAEITARQKQYEFYREKLLSFKEVDHGQN